MPNQFIKIWETFLYAIFNSLKLLIKISIPWETSLKTKPWETLLKNYSNNQIPFPSLCGAR